MALSAASRASSIKQLKIKFVARNNTSYKFYFHKLHMGWRRGKTTPTVSYVVYFQDLNLCLIKTLDEYISHTESWRSGDE